MEEENKKLKDDIARLEKELADAFALNDQNCDIKDSYKEQIKKLKAENESLKLSLHSARGGILHYCTVCGKSFMTELERIEHIHETPGSKKDSNLFKLDKNDPYYRLARKKIKINWPPKDGGKEGDCVDCKWNEHGNYCNKHDRIETSACDEFKKRGSE